MYTLCSVIDFRLKLTPNTAMEAASTTTTVTTSIPSSQDQLKEDDQLSCHGRHLSSTEKVPAKQVELPEGGVNMPKDTVHRSATEGQAYTPRRSWSSGSLSSSQYPRGSGSMHHYGVSWSGTQLSEWDNSPLSCHELSSPVDRTQELSYLVQPCPQGVQPCKTFTVDPAPYVLDDSGGGDILQQWRLARKLAQARYVCICVYVPSFVSLWDDIVYIM